MRGAFALGLAGLLSCARPGPDGGESPPLFWRLVEVASPGGMELVLEAGPPGEADAAADVEVRLSRERAGVGEVVEAEIRLRGGVGRRWVEVHPGRPGVRLLGERAWIVEGEGPVTARFTCDTPGPGGIVVLVRD